MSDDDGSVQLISEWPPPDSMQGDVEEETDTVPIKKFKSAPGIPASISCSAEASGELLADIAFSKWWRKQGNVQGISSTNAQTILHHAQKSLRGQDFLERESDRLRGLIRRSNNAGLKVALATYLERLGRFEEASELMEKADPTECEERWVRERILRQRDHARVQRSALDKLQRHDVTVPPVQQVPRIDHSNWSVERFHKDFALPGRPVVITGMRDVLTTQDWTLEHIKDVAGSCNVTLRRSCSDSVEWARLEEAEVATVAGFVDKVRAGGAADRYLFDWSLGLHCRELAQELTVPKYFANDFLKRTSPGSLYRDSWPSLFISPADITSELHVDAFHSNFWMALFSGKKKWMFFGREATSYLYPRYQHSLDPVFAVDLDTPDLKTHPLLALARPYECVLEPGDVLFVPAGSPHRVQNLAPSVAVSANFVDLSNFSGVLEELTANALLDPRATDLLSQFEAKDFDRTMDFNTCNVPLSRLLS